MGQLTIRRGSISGFDARVDLPNVPHDEGRFAGFRDLMWEAWGQRLSQAGYRERLEEKIAAQLGNERELQRWNRSEMREDQAWYHGQHDRDDTLAAEVPELRDLTVNIIRPAVDYVIGTAKGLRLEGSVTPTGGTNYTDDQLDRVAQEFDARLKIAQNVGGFTKAKNMAIHSACTAGVGYWETVVRHHPASGTNHIEFNPLDWRNCYKDSSARDMRHARYFYTLRRVDLNTMYDLFPKRRGDLHDMQTEFTTRVAVDDSYEIDEPHVGVYSDLSGYRTTSPRDSGDFVRPMIIMGVGWYKEAVIDRNGHMQDVCVKVVFASDEGFEQVKLLKDPMFVYGHNQIPVTELAFQHRDEDRLPYTPLIRNRRGMQKAVRILLRHVVTHLRSRGALIDINSIPKGVDVGKYIHDCMIRIGMPLFVLPMFGEKGIQIVQNDRRVEQLSDMMMTLINLSQDHSGVHPSLLGNKTNVEAAVAMKKMADDAMRVQSGFLENLTYAVKDSCEKALSLIEQFVGLIDYPARRERGQMIQMAADGDLTIKGNMAMFMINPVMREDTLSEAHLSLFNEAVKVHPPLAPVVLPSIMRSMHIDDARDVADDIVETMKSQGQPVPPSMLSREERQAQAQAQAQQAQMAQAAQQAEIQKVQSEGQKNQALAQKAVAEAESPSQSEKETELRQTIERLSRELQERGKKS